MFGPQDSRQEPTDLGCRIRSRESLKVLLEESNLYATVPPEDSLEGRPIKLVVIVYELLREFALAPVAIGKAPVNTAQFGRSRCSARNTDRPLRALSGPVVGT